ncbi:MAG: mechanosensitive ion channel family protein, partial [Candidatus Micrarchaeaceae archaeon]
LLKDDLSIIYIPNSALNVGLIQNISRLDERMLRVRLEVSRDTDIEAFERDLLVKLSSEKDEYEKLLNLDIVLSLMSTEQDLGIIITARVKMLDYERLGQWVVESAIKSLQDIKSAKANTAAQHTSKPRLPAKRRRKRKG